MRKQRVFVAGHNGMVGAALVEQLKKIDSVQLVVKDKAELDLLDFRAVDDFFKSTSIDQVYIAAAKVGGIHANDQYPADFILQNLSIQNNLISSAHSQGVEKLLMLGSSCIYPKFAKQPISEEELMSGALEKTNEPYAVAKIAGIKLCESFNRQFGTDYRSVMPTNLYGPNDNFHPENSHVIPAMMRRFHEAKLRGSEEVVVWGTGRPMREFLFVEDMARACIHVMNIDKEAFWSRVDARCSHINVGTGRDCTIRELAETMADVVGFKGELIFDHTKPDGTPRKLLATEKLVSLGWSYEIELRHGLKSTYSWYLNNQESLRGTEA